jgi:hypothetical protein
MEVGTPSLVQAYLRVFLLSESKALCGTKNLTELTEWLQSLQNAYRKN